MIRPKCECCRCDINEDMEQEGVYCNDCVNGLELAAYNKGRKQGRLEGAKRMAEGVGLERMHGEIGAYYQSGYNDAKKEVEEKIEQVLEEMKDD